MDPGKQIIANSFKMQTYRYEKFVKILGELDAYLEEFPDQLVIPLKGSMLRNCDQEKEYRIRTRNKIRTANRRIDQQKLVIQRGYY